MPIEVHPTLTKVATHDLSDHGTLYGFSSPLNPTPRRIFPIAENIFLSFGGEHTRPAANPAASRLGATTFRIDPRTYELEIISNIALFDGSFPAGGGDSYTWFDSTLRRFSYVYKGHDTLPNKLAYGALTWDASGVLSVVNSGTVDTTTAQGLANAGSGTSMFAGLASDFSSCALVWITATASPSNRRGAFQTATLDIDSGAFSEWGTFTPAGSLIGVGDPHWADWRGFYQRGGRMYAHLQNNSSDNNACTRIEFVLNTGTISWNVQGPKPSTAFYLPLRPTIINGRHWPSVEDGDFLLTEGGDYYFGYWDGDGNAVLGPGPRQFDPDPNNTYYQPEWRYPLIEVDGVARYPFYGTARYVHDVLDGPGYEVEDRSNYAEYSAVEITADLQSLTRYFPHPIVSNNVNPAESPLHRSERDGYVRISFQSSSLRVYATPEPLRRCPLDIGQRVLAIPTSDGNDYVVFCVLDPADVPDITGCGLDLGQRVLALPLAEGNDYAISCGSGEPPAIGQRVFAVPFADDADYTILT